MKGQHKVNIIIAILQILIIVELFIGNKFDISIKDFTIFSLMSFLFYLLVFFLLPKKILKYSYWYILGLNAVVIILLSIYHLSHQYNKFSNEDYIFGLTLAYYFCEFIRFKKQAKTDEKQKVSEETDDSLIRKRFYAFFIDFIISAFLFLVPYEFFVLEPVFKKSQVLQSNVFITTLLCSIPAAIYLVFRDCPFKGSIGKRILKLDLLTEDGSKNVSVKQSILRNITMLILFVEIFYFLKNKKRLGDKLAHTKIEEKKKL
jgi:uncharacterized RDD family membrane protein YckC